jgi:hypothetical protein
MKRFTLSLFIALALSFTGIPLSFGSMPVTVLAQKSVHAKGYTTKSGKVVEPYDRKPPKSKGSSGTSSTPATATTPKSSTACTSCERDAKGKIARSESAKETFMRESGYPKGRPGYVVDHIIPLACGGADAPGNMQWQSLDQAKAKDKVERKGCRAA